MSVQWTLYASELISTFWFSHNFWLRVLFSLQRCHLCIILITGLLTRNNDAHSVKYTHFKQGNFFSRLIFFSKSCSKSMRQRNNKVTFLFLFQKQSFADVLLNKCSKTFCKFDRKIPLLDSLFNKVAVLKACNFVNKRLQHKCFPVKFAKTFNKKF